MKYSREYLDRLAGHTGFRSETLEKVLRLERLLDLVNRHPFLGPRLLLKGGTALNLFFGRVPRLSVDLDFNYIGELDRDAMLVECPEIERALDVIAAGEEYRLQRAAEEHAGRKFFLGYRNALGTQDRIEVDLNYMFRVPLAPPDLRDAWTPDADFPCRACVAGLEEVVAGKLVALIDRTAARDLYDIAAFVADPPGHDPDLLRHLFMALASILPRALTAHGPSCLSALTQRDLDERLAPTLRAADRAMVDTLRSLISPLLGRLLTLTPDEREYSERLQWGEFLPERIAGTQPDLLGRLRLHPAILWKLENARRRPPGAGPPRKAEA